MLGEDFAGLPMLALKLGYSLRFFPPRYRQMVDAMLNGGPQLQLRGPDQTEAPPQKRHRPSSGAFFWGVRLRSSDSGATP